MPKKTKQAEDNLEYEQDSSTGTVTLSQTLADSSLITYGGPPWNLSSKVEPEVNIDMLSFGQKIKIANQMITLFDEDGPIAKQIKSVPNGKWVFETVFKAVEKEAESLMGDASAISLEVNDTIARIKDLTRMVEESHGKVLNGLKVVLSQSVGKPIQPNIPQQSHRTQMPPVRMSSEVVTDDDSPTSIIGM